MMPIAHIPVAILAGGLGTRLRPAIGDVPKSMALINGKPFLHYQLEWLIRQGTREVVLCTGHRGEQIQDFFADKYGPIKIMYSHEVQPLGTAGALRYALEKIQNDHFLAINGDSFGDANLSEFVAWHQSKPFSASILLAFQNDVHRFGSVVTDKQGYVLEFQEKTKRQGGGFVSAGIYLLNRKVLEAIPSDQALSMELEVLPELIGKGLSGYKSSSSFIDIGTPDSYRLALNYFQHLGLATTGVPG